MELLLVAIQAAAAAEVLTVLLKQVGVAAPSLAVQERSEQLAPLLKAYRFRLSVATEVEVEG